jgi:hypothetical protein
VRVIVTAFGDLRRHLLDGAPQRTLGAEPDELPLARRGVEIVREATPRRDGDQIELFAPIGGG